MLAGKPSRWPAIWGTIAILFGLGGLVVEGGKIMHAFGTLMTPDDLYENLVADFAGTGDSEQDRLMEEAVLMQKEIHDEIRELVPMILGSSSFLLVLAIVLIAGGICLCIRMPVARKILTTWSVLKILGGVASAWVAYQSTIINMSAQSDLLEAAMMGTSGGGSPSPVGLDRIMTEFIPQLVLITCLLWTWWLPIFFTVWFNRDLVQQDMKSWNG